MMRVIFYTSVIATIATSCLDFSNTIKTVGTALPPSSIDSTLSVGDYTFGTKVDSSATPILTE